MAWVSLFSALILDRSNPREGIALPANRNTVRNAVRNADLLIGIERRSADLLIGITFLANQEIGVPREIGVPPEDLG